MPRPRNGIVRHWRNRSERRTTKVVMQQVEYEVSDDEGSEQVEALWNDYDHVQTVVQDGNNNVVFASIQ